jgi:hypothetical protein
MNCHRSFTNVIKITDTNFNGIPASTNRAESVMTLPDRTFRILSYFARIPLPLNDSSDDMLPLNEDITLPPTNPYWNSREDSYQVATRYISRILLGCYNNTDLDQIILDPLTRPFAISGTSFASATPSCIRDGDYDFVTIDLMQLLYVSKQYPGSLSTMVYTKIRDRLLTTYGPITDNTIKTPCKFNFGPFRVRFDMKNIEDTENHIIQSQVSRYLTNQILIDVHPERQREYNNTLNGNTAWMLEYFSTFVSDYFYEYNSRPYQAFTMKALNVLHSYSNDAEVVLLSEIVLDIISAYSSLQMNT